MLMLAAVCGVALGALAMPASAGPALTTEALKGSLSTTLIEEASHGARCHRVHVRRCLERMRRYGRRICVRWVDSHHLVCHH